MQMKRSMCITSRLALVAAVTLTSVGAVSRPAAAAVTNTVSFGGSYSNNFNDLPTVSASVNSGGFTIKSTGVTTTPVTTAVDSLQNDFTLADTTQTGAWYAGSSGTKTLLVGAHNGDQTTGGVIDFGANSATPVDRALGLLATSTNGDTTIGVELINNTASPISSINVSFLGEKWRDGKVANTTKSLNFAYLQVAAASTGSSTLPIATSTAGLTQVPVLSFTTTTTGSPTGTALDGTLAANQTPESGTVTLGSSWNVGDGLWLTWQIPGAVGSGDGLAIDNLSVTVPEPASLALIGLGGLGMLRRRRA